MKPIEEFLGINNVAQAERLKAGELTAARNLDLTTTRALATRRGRSILRPGDAHSLYRAPFGLLAVIDMDLGLMSDDGATFTPLYFALGCDDRVWYATLPDNRVVFSNGFVTGITDGAVVTPWGITPPVDRGDSVVGETPYWLTYIRLFDRRESAPLYCPPTLIGAPLTGLPQQDGYAIAVYYATDGNTGFKAGETLTDEFTYTGARDALLPPCQTEHLHPMPPGICLAAWGARMLIAVDKTLWATAPYRIEHRDVRRDFVQMTDPITFVHGVDAGIWVGTTKELAFLRGQGLATLQFERVRAGPVVLGSGAQADFTLMAPEARPGSLEGAFCISNGEIVACGNTGAFQAYTAGKYKTAFTEVVSTTRVRDGVLQYLASGADPEVPFDLFVLQPLALAGEMGVTGDTMADGRVTFDVDATQAIGIAATLAVLGDIEATAPAAPVIFNFTQEVTLALTAAIELVGDIEVQTEFALAPTEAIGVTGALGLAGDVAIDTAFDLAPTSAIGVAGTLAVDADLFIGVKKAIVRTGTVAMTGAIGIAGNFNVSLGFALVPTAPIGMRGAVGVAGELGIGVQTILEAPILVAVTGQLTVTGDITAT